MKNIYLFILTFKNVLLYINDEALTHYLYHEIQWNIIFTNELYNFKFVASSLIYNEFMNISKYSLVLQHILL